MAAVRNFYTVKYIRLPELLTELAIARNNGTYHKVITQYKKPSLLILDEWLLYSLKYTEARDLLEIAEARYKKASTIFCSQFDVPGWMDKIGDPLIADVYLFHCLTPSRINPDDCPGVTIREDVLLDLLCDLLTCELETSLGSCLMQADTNNEYEQSRIELKNKISSRRQEIVRLRGLARSLYENLVNGNITKDEYYDYKAKYEGKINMIAPEIETLEQALQLIEKQEEQQRRLAKDAESIRQDHELTAALIDRLIERVDVSSDKQISVTYRFKSEYENCKEVLRQCRNM